MSGLLRKLAIYLCSPIYKLIKYVYYIFYNLANTRFLNSEIISQFSSNIYVLVSVVMLFAFSVVILSAIVNPDLLSDNKKGVTALFKRSILALFLMVLVPFMFNILYKLQSNIMDNSLIEKIIVGTNISCQQDESESADDSTTDDTSDTVDESESKCKSGGNGGQVIAGTLISALVYPIEDNINVDEDVQKSYEAMIVEDIKHIGNFAEHINATTDGEDAGWLAGSDTNYAFVFNGLLAIVCGLGCVYILVIFSLDVAVRVFKLAFMELTAPISIVGYIAAGNKILSSWFQELVKTYVDLFIRIASIAFYLFLISNLSSFLEPFQNEDWGFVLKAFLVVGMLIFVKQVPDLINKIFGTDIKLKGGIGGRLGEMAAVGKQAQKAWGAVKNVAALGAGAAALGAAALTNPALAAGVGLAQHGWRKGFKTLNARPGKETATGRFISGAGKSAGAFLKANGALSGISAGKKAFSESDFGAEIKANKAYRKNKDATRAFNSKMKLDENGFVVDANASEAALNANLKKDLGATGAAALQNLHKANYAKAVLDRISSDKDVITSELELLQNNAKTQAASDAILNLKNEFAGGNLSSDSMRSKINAMVDSGTIVGSSAKKISGKLDSIDSEITNNSEIVGNLRDTDGTLKVGTNLKIMKEQNATTVEGYKKAYDNVYKGAPESVKETMDRYVSTSDAIIKQSVVDKSKNDSHNHSDDAHYQSDYIVPNLDTTDESNNTNNNSNFSQTSHSSNGESLNLDFSQTAQEPLKPEDYNIPESTGMSLNLEKQRLDEEERKLNEDYDNLNYELEKELNDMKKMNSETKTKFKLKDDNK